MILKDGNHYLQWEALKSTVKDLLKIAEDLDPDKIQIKLKELLPEYTPRSLLSVSRDDRFESYTIKGEA